MWEHYSIHVEKGEIDAMPQIEESTYRVFQDDEEETLVEPESAQDTTKLLIGESAALIIPPLPDHAQENKDIEEMKGEPTSQFVLIECKKDIESIVKTDDNLIDKETSPLCMIENVTSMDINAEKSDDLNNILTPKE